MTLKTYFFGFLVLFGLLLPACGGKEDETDTTDAVVREESVWTDSIFGAISERQRYYQHLVIEVPAIYQSKSDSLGNWIIENQPGALRFEGWQIDSVLQLRQRLDTHDIIQPLIYSSYFSDLNVLPYPYWEISKRLRSDEFVKVLAKGQLNLMDLEQNFPWTTNLSSWADTIRKRQKLFPIVRHYSDKRLGQDYDQFFADMRVMDHLMELELTQYDTVKLDGIRKSGGYRGLFLVDAKRASTNALITGGADLVYRSIEVEDAYDDWTESSVSTAFEESTKRILQLKSKLSVRSMIPQNMRSELKYVQTNLQHQGSCLISNKGKAVPFEGRFSIYTEDAIRLPQKIKKEGSIRTYQKELNVKLINDLLGSDEAKVICVSDSTKAEVLALLSGIEADNKTVVCFSNPSQFKQLQEVPNLLFVPSKKMDYSILAQQMNARLRTSGGFFSGDSLYESVKIPKQRLARTTPEFVGLDPDTLARIDWGVRGAMGGRAFPGCQVLIAKDGCIIYDKSFGHHSYQRRKQVTPNSMYDLASLTKVVSTTMVGMKLWEQGMYKLSDSLHKYQADSLKKHLRYPSSVRNITFQELFIHKSGLPAGFPIIDYMRYTNDEIGRYDRYYCDTKDEFFCVEVADGYYLDREFADSMWIKLNSMWLDKSKPYKYSDVSMNMLYSFFKSIIWNNRRKFNYVQKESYYKNKDLFVEFLYDNYYRPLGMEHSRYKPLRHHDTLQIVPTENESYWRKQLLRGHVHDPNAALMGGIAGNAGMFSTTNDLAILAQMLLNKGTYAGKRYLQAETVQKFTSVQPDSHRGLGWNKPTISSSGYGCADSASLATFGHTGFTGTCIWMDPVTNLTYVFLSNRVHPKVNNRIYQYGIRKRVHQAAYDAMMNGSGTRN